MPMSRRYIQNDRLDVEAPSSAHHETCASHREQTMAEIYIPTEQYRAVVNAIAAMTLIDPDEIKIALGEEGNIWPASIHSMTATSI
jgi:hypothetical protein